MKILHRLLCELVFRGNNCFPRKMFLYFVTIILIELCHSFLRVVPLCAVTVFLCFHLIYSHDARTHTRTQTRQYVFYFCFIAISIEWFSVPHDVQPAKTLCTLEREIFVFLSGDKVINTLLYLLFSAILFSTVITLHRFLYKRSRSNCSGCTVSAKESCYAGKVTFNVFWSRVDQAVLFLLFCTKEWPGPC